MVTGFLVACGSSSSNSTSATGGGASTAGTSGSNGAGGSNAAGRAGSAGSSAGEDSAGAAGDTSSGGLSDGGSPNAGMAGDDGPDTAGAGGSVATCVPAAEPGNLLKNGSFRCDTSGWLSLDDGISLSWDPRDALGKPGSGSMQSSSTVEINSGFAQCVPVSEGKKYTFSAQANIPVSATNGHIYVQILWSGIADCIHAPAFLGELTQIYGSDTRGVWQTLATSAPLTPPAGAVSARIYGQIVDGYMATGPIEFNPSWDNFVFREVN
jgi:hypothetical protein